MIRFEWDDPKSEQKSAKHGIDFQTARLVFDDPHCITFVERVAGGERRWHAIGTIAQILIVVVAHTYRDEGSDEVIRIISARRATSHERRLYEQAIKE
ncbi:MAG: BrnT family toxin [Acidobacteria bacterium]|nr:MAG: BrnT family toxin [Acidobacteriota bacterium]